MGTYPAGHPYTLQCSHGTVITLDKPCRLQCPIDVKASAAVVVSERPYALPKLVDKNCLHHRKKL